MRLPGWRGQVQCAHGDFRRAYGLGPSRHRYRPGRVGAPYRRTATAVACRAGRNVAVATADSPSDQFGFAGVGIGGTQDTSLLSRTIPIARLST